MLTDLMVDGKVAKKTTVANKFKGVRREKARDEYPNPEDEGSLPPPPESDDGDIATPKSQVPTEDDQPLD